LHSVESVAGRSGPCARAERGGLVREATRECSIGCVRTA